MEPVRELLVDVLVGSLGRDKGGDDEVDVGEEEEDGDGERRLEGRVPVVDVSVEVQPDEAKGDKRVDHGEWVRDDVEDCELARGQKL